MLWFFFVNYVINSAVQPIVYSIQFNSSPPSAAYLREWNGSSMAQVMACRLFGAKPLSEPTLTHCLLYSWEYISVKFVSELFSFKKMQLKMSSAKMAAILSRGDRLNNGQMSIHLDTIRADIIIPMKTFVTPQVLKCVLINSRIWFRFMLINIILQYLNYRQACLCSSN